MKILLSGLRVVAVFVLVFAVAILFARDSSRKYSLNGCIINVDAQEVEVTGGDVPRVNYKGFPLMVIHQGYSIFEYNDIRLKALEVKPSLRSYELTDGAFKTVITVKGCDGR